MPIREKGPARAGSWPLTSRSLVSTRLTLPARTGPLRHHTRTATVRKTHCRREMDSNHRYRVRNNPFWVPRWFPQFAFNKTDSFVPGTERRYGAGGEDGNFVAVSNDGVPRCPSRTT